MKRTLGRSGIEVSALGMGCWAIGGPWKFMGNPAGWSEVDDAESIRALQTAFEMGVTFYDTAANYGCGHSERLLAQAFKGKRDQIMIATKFGYDVDQQNKTVRPYGEDEEHSDVAGHLWQDLEDSLKNLETDYIDVYQLHVWGLDIEHARQVRDILEEMVKQGKIRIYGWSTDRVDAVRDFAQGPNCDVLQQNLSIFDGNLELLALAEELNLASINRGPLGMGFLTGKFTPQTTFPDDDVRAKASWYPGFVDGKPNEEWFARLEAIREVITSGGRSLAQGALAWLWGKSNNTIPIPGFKTVKQVQDNAGALAFGPLTSEQMAEVDNLLK